VANIDWLNCALIRITSESSRAVYLHGLRLDVTTPVWRSWIEQMSRTFRLVRYDARGCGRSDGNIQSNSFATYDLDLEAVVNAIRKHEFHADAVVYTGLSEALEWVELYASIHVRHD